MSWKRGAALTLVLGGTLLTGCQSGRNCQGGLDKNWKGTVAGAVVGAAAGRAIAGHDRAAEGIIIGAIVGGLVGYGISYSLSCELDENNVPPERRASPEFQEAKQEFAAGNEHLARAQRASSKDEAAAHLEQAKGRMGNAIAKSPESPEPHVNLGVILMEQGDYAGARAEFEQAIDLDPDNAEALANLRRLDEDEEAAAEEAAARGGQ